MFFFLPLARKKTGNICELFQVDENEVLFEREKIVVPFFFREGECGI